MSQLHHILLGQGYRYTKLSKLPTNFVLRRYAFDKGFYVKEFSTNVGTFSIALWLREDPHVRLPSAYVYKMPEEYKQTLIPHIAHDGYLCYVEQAEADWDPNNLEVLFQLIDKQINDTIIKIAECISDDSLGDLELENEFTAYWEHSDSLYLISEAKRGSSLKTRSAIPIRSIAHNNVEYITYASNDTKYIPQPVERWLYQRGLRFDNEPAVLTHYITVNPCQLSGVSWPPSSLRELFSWLTNVDLNARNHIADCLLGNNIKKHVLILEIRGQDLIAIDLMLSPKIVHNRHQSQKTKKAHKRQSVRNKVSILSGKESCSEFKRFSVTKADIKTLGSRSKTQSLDLSNKRIALIGCGTIGGYLSHLLLRNGAGFAASTLSLFDKDNFQPHNFLRHPLTSNDFGENKANALANKLLDSIHLAKNIKAFSVNFPIEESKLALYDIIIDATGRPPVSKRLAFVKRTMAENKRPILIHAFNDGNGRASKVFIDNGQSCYKCMTLDSTIHYQSINGIDMDSRFKDVDQAAEKFMSCGSTYTPYDAAVSHITAGIAQEAVLNSLQVNLPWTYSEFMLDNSFRTSKRKILDKNSKCTICNG